MATAAKVERPKMAELLSAGKKGAAEIDIFEIGAPDLRMMFRPDEYVRAGKYARLKIHGSTYMSDTDMEWRTNRGFLFAASGRVLVTGLGIGFIVLPALRKAEVASLTIVEKHPDVIALVEPQIRAKLTAEQNAKLRIVLADAYDWKPEQKGRQFDVIYHDIWADQSTDALEDMARLKRHYAPLLVPGGSQSCWREAELRSRKRQERNAPWNLR